MNRNKWVRIGIVLLVLIFAFSLTLAWAEPLEEEEEPIQTRPSPMNRTMGKSAPVTMQSGKTGLGTRIMPGAGTFRLKDGRQVQVVKGSRGNQLFLLQGRGKRPAPDGVYTQQNGQTITVRGGLVVGQKQMPIDPYDSNTRQTQGSQKQMPIDPLGSNAMQAPGSQKQLGGEDGPIEGMRTR